MDSGGQQAAACLVCVAAFPPENRGALELLGPWRD